MKKGYRKIKITFLFIFVIFLFVIYSRAVNNSDAQDGASKEVKNFYDFSDYNIGKEIEKRARRSGATEKRNLTIGITSHHLPTALPLIFNFYNQLATTKQTFVVIGPDHFERCKNKIVFSGYSYKTPFGFLDSDRDSVGLLRLGGIVEDVNCFKAEHAIGVQAIFIKRFFPKVKIIPILISSAATENDLENFVDILAGMNDIVIIGSMDFSHYKNLEEANRLDGESKKYVLSDTENGFRLDNIDSPPTIKLLMKLARRLNLSPFIIDNKNSFDFNGQRNNITSYMNIIYEKN